MPDPEPGLLSISTTLWSNRAATLAASSETPAVVEKAESAMSLLSVYRYRNDRRSFLYLREYGYVCVEATATAPYERCPNWTLQSRISPPRTILNVPDVPTRLLDSSCNKSSVSLSCLPSIESRMSPINKPAFSAGPSVRRRSASGPFPGCYRFERVARRVDRPIGYQRPDKLA